jgi:hypothetical protein
LADAEVIAGGPAFSTDYEFDVRASSDDDGVFIIDQPLLDSELATPLDSISPEDNTAGIFTDRGLLTDSLSDSLCDDVNPVAPASESITETQGAFNTAMSRDATASTNGGFLMPSLADDGAQSLPKGADDALLASQALTALVKQLRLNVRRFEPPAILSALRSLEALSRPGDPNHLIKSFVH